MNLSGFRKKAVNTLQLVVDRYPGELQVQNDLGVKYLLAGQQNDARKTFTQVTIWSSFSLGLNVISMSVSFCVLLILSVIANARVDVC